MELETVAIIAKAVAEKQKGQKRNFSKHTDAVQGRRRRSEGGGPAVGRVARANNEGTCAEDTLTGEGR